ncbi:MAG: ELWxxDGT repeat protein [Saprospiraceae bacterium]
MLLSFLSINTNQAQLLLKDINSGTANAAPNNFIEMDGIIYFEATTTANGQELWRSDGTEAGTTLLKDINPGSGNSTIDQFTVMDGNLYFIASDGGASFGKEIWMTDGTTAGTTVIDVNPGTASSNPDHLVVMNDALYFAATSGSSGIELWKCTPGGATMVADINPAAPGSSFPAEMTVYNNEIYFRADNGTNGLELWKSDGTTGGTVMLQDIHPSNSSAPDNFCVSNGLLFFSANNGTDGNELYKTDGTTVNMIDVNPSGDGNPTELFDFNNVLYFAAEDNVSGFTKLWTSDGTTTQLHASSMNNPSDMFAWNDKLYLRGDGELQIIDGATTEEVDINSGGGTSDPKGFVQYKNRVLFIADDGDGNEIWISDGTIDGTKMAMDINGVATSSGVTELAAAGNYLFFNGDDGTNGSEVNVIGDCDPNRPGTTMEMIKESGRHSSLFETTDVNGWTHYCDCKNDILLSIEKGSTGVIIPSDSVSIDIPDGIHGFGFAEIVPQGCDSGDCFIMNDQGSVIFTRKWDVRPTTQPNSDLAVRLYFSNQEYSDVNSAMMAVLGTSLTNPNEMSFYKVTNGSLGQFPLVNDVKVGDAKVLTHSSTPSTASWNYAAFGTDHCSEFKVSSFSGGGGGAGSAGTPLPVELLDFWARPDVGENVINLNWTTASEENNYGFFIERSPNLSDWQIIGFVKGTEEGVFPAEYKFVDQHPKAGDNYYRLRQRDYDGKEEFSPTTHVSMDLTIVGNVYPNPVKISTGVMLDITTSVKGDATVQVFNMSRQVVIQNEYELVEGPQLIPLDLQNIPSGIYIIKVESRGMVMNTKLLVQE